MLPELPLPLLVPPDDGGGLIGLDGTPGLDVPVQRLNGLDGPDDVPEEENEPVKQSIIAANNHYAGFGPGTANIFRKMLGLTDAKWEDKVEEEREFGPPHQFKQHTLSDFFK